MNKLGYAIGRIRSLEAQMLSTSHFTRMAESKDFESSFFVLTETSYSEKIDRLSNPFNFGELVNIELDFIKSFLINMAPESEIIDVLLKKFSLPYLTLIDYIKMLEKTAKKNNVFLFKEYVEAFAALQTLLLNTETENLTMEEAAEKIKYKNYSNAVLKSLPSKNLFVLEREIDNHLIEIVQKAKYMAFGIEPLIGFLIGKEMETKNIKLILTGKLLGLETEEIKKRLRKAYV
ncbi:hypothetical protein A2230_00215 [candidate division WOR-1 bacterium RIFOXYA2_FULL_36_21]|uniref:V-type ATP synthase subunit C n=1 Tax=candidate division WOR-1 bacterium RIFOXYB2_FULL_36_35 TaxID=1802578 RepID=A0A1F4RZY3_UNCSA|nr:MAG: hypothetical protein A2230_00215 [candidate division WOR-1 bacterium RIFOXYA2_FULL_36_21]OGC13744.1 MAG: hypothetical protein A2290_07715 [candidate division WOR-1 bacterium RIFOXYB2_FULL_36_35]OGC14467.1 MAG: hypothetical protein A2282_08715 [candidate division WOR-1 bacterium RIFOXYA12_FULL_36_13]